MKNRAYAAFRYGKLLYGIIGSEKHEVELWVKAYYQSELKLELHELKDVLTDHGIEICEVEIKKVGEKC